jgi:hypothetical protein
VLKSSPSRRGYAVKRILSPDGLANILAQAPALSAAFGRWPGFVVMMTALLGVLMLGVATLLIASKSL